MNYKLDVELSPELETYRNAIEATIKPYIKIELTDNNNPSLWQSKFGGLPYMPKGYEYPKSNDGKYLYLLAQINFAEVPQLESLPNTGILQFYIANDDLWSLDLARPTQQNKFRVIYFEATNLSERDLVTDFSFLTPETEEYLEYLPMNGCSAIKFQISHAPISISDYQFDIFDFEEVSDNAYYEYWDKCVSDGHKLLGYPCFTQDDPRHNLSTTEEPYILLLQIDTDGKDDFEIMWGDAGIGNFFIKPSALAKLDFSEVLYNWDCA